MTRDKNVLIRVSEEEKARWKKAAGAKSVSEWVRDLVEKKLNPPAVWIGSKIGAPGQISSATTTTSLSVIHKFKPDPKPTTKKKSRGR